LPQGVFQAVEEQELEVVTGGTLDLLATHRLSFPSEDKPGRYPGPGTATVLTNDISPEAMISHRQTMSVQPAGTKWLHVPMPQPNGEILHTYAQIPEI